MAGGGRDKARDKADRALVALIHFLDIDDQEERLHIISSLLVLIDICDTETLLILSRSIAEPFDGDNRPASIILLETLHGKSFAGRGKLDRLSSVEGRDGLVKALPKNLKRRRKK